MSDQDGARVQDSDHLRRQLEYERAERLQRLAAEYVPPRWLLDRMIRVAVQRNGDPAKNGFD